MLSFSEVLLDEFSLDLRESLFQVFDVIITKTTKRAVATDPLGMVKLDAKKLPIWQLQNLEHLLVCPILENSCTFNDLETLTPQARVCVQHLIGVMYRLDQK